MGGGGKGGRKASTPQFVKDASASLGERSQQLFDLSRPLLEQGTGQVASLIRTGGPGANVPILNNAIAAQQAATSGALDLISGDLQRSGVAGSPAGNRLTANIAQRGADIARRIPIEAAAPLISGASAGALSGGGAAQQGFQGAAQALAAGQRQPIRSQSAANAGRNLFQLAQFGLGGGFGGGGKGGGVPNQQNPFGSGISPTGSFLIGPGGTLGGGV